MAIADRAVAVPLIHWRVWLLVIFLGLAIAVAATARVDCRNNYLLVNDGSRILINDNGALLMAGRQCELKAEPYRMALPSWVNRIAPW
jgi:hypothetical protein